jgi:N-acetyl-gamma-glutamylphosphate reductase
MPKLFITGITGYVGGDAFHLLSQQHRDFEFSALIRTEAKAKYVRELYPNVRIVIGGLDDADKIEKEAAWADIVLRRPIAPRRVKERDI